MSELINEKGMKFALEKFYAWARQPAPDETIVAMWLEKLRPLQPTGKEVWAAMTNIMFEQEPGMVPIREIADLIRHERQKQQAMLPPAPEPPRVSDLPPDERRNFCLTVYGAIFKHQGDTKFYRNMLAKNTVWGQTGFLAGTPAVTHEEVMAFLEGRLNAA